MENFAQGLLEFLTKNQWVAIVLALWAIPWKGIALWKAAKKNHIYWFVAFMVVNTVGLLEILYIFVLADYKKKGPATAENKGDISVKEEDNKEEKTGGEAKE